MPMTTTTTLVDEDNVMEDAATPPQLPQTTADTTTDNQQTTATGSDTITTPELPAPPNNNLPEPQTEPTPATSPTADEPPQLPPQQALPDPHPHERLYAQRAAYIPPDGAETFDQMRARVDRQETLLHYQPHGGGIAYGPNRERFARPTPYHRSTQPQEEDVQEQTYQVHDDVNIQCANLDNLLPPGWQVQNGAFYLGDAHDEWVLQKGWLVRKHYLPRTTKYNPASREEECPVPLNYLSKDRITRIGGRSAADRWRNKTDDVQGAT